MGSEMCIRDRKKSAIERTFSTSCNNKHDDDDDDNDDDDND